MAASERAGIRGQLVGLAIGAVAGYLAYRAGMPLPWMLGPMIANTIVAVAGAPVMPPVRLRPLVIPVIGVMLGATVTAEVLSALGRWAVSVALLAPFLATASFGSYQIYRRIGGYDRVSAYFAAMPGGVNEMVLIGSAAGGQERKIALAHASRILLVILFVGLFYGLVLGVRSTGNARPWTALSTLSAMDYAAFLACALAGSWLGKRLRLPAGNMLGPMVLSAALHVGQWVEVPPPTLFIIAAQIVLGTIIGCRFRGAQLREVAADMWLGFLSTLVMLAAAVSFAALVGWLTGMDVAAVFLAYSPGGLTEMSLLALAIHQDVAYVSVSHIVRILMVIVAAPLVFRRSG